MRARRQANTRKCEHGRQSACTNCRLFLLMPDCGDVGNEWLSWLGANAHHEAPTENFAMNSWSFRRAILALVIGVGVVAGLVRGQDARPMPPANAPAPSTTPPAVIISQDQQAAPYSQVQSAQPRILEHLNRHGLHCFATLGSLGCGSCKSECQFIFGSCRTFFGEPCIPDAGHGYGAYGYGTNGRAKGGCGCP
jgi:hypothetical protein